MILSTKNFAGVALDFDGTIALTLPAHMQAREHAFKEHGIEVSEEQKAIGHHHGNTVTTIIAGVLKAAGHIPADADPHEHELVKTVVATKNEYYRQITREGLELQPGFKEFMKQAVSNYGATNILVVTTSPLADITSTLERNGLSKYFTPERLITADTAHERGLALKPAPDQYEYAAKVLGIPAAKMLVVEDSTGGVLAAHAAGSPVLAVGTTSPRDIFFADTVQHPDYFAESFLDVAWDE
jgi:beta-phosphoglucomutase